MLLLLYFELISTYILVQVRLNESDMKTLTREELCAR